MERRVSAGVVIVLLFLACPAWGQLKLAGIFGDNMVLQRGERVAVWGKAEPGKDVRVELDDLAQVSAAQENGHWRVELDTSSLPVGPHRLLVQSGVVKVQVDNVLIGDVWVASGQSNMEWPVGASANAGDEIASANYPQIRHFGIAKRVSHVPLDNVEGTWEVCSPTTVAGFTAVGYFFARRVHQETGTPIGIIHTSWGGTPVEAWMSDAVLGQFPEFVPRLAARDHAAHSGQADQKRYRQELAAWEEKVLAKDAGNQGFDKGWAHPASDVSDWPAMELPRNWERAGLAINGAVWFRREVEIPEDWMGRELTLSLGPIDDYDVTYFNNVQVGQTDRTTANYWMTPRAYQIPAELVHTGRNVIAVRVFDHGGGGGFHGEPQQMRLIPGDGPAMPLHGEWKYRVEQEIQPPSREVLATRPEGPKFDQNSPGVLFNAMIHPIVGYGIRGAIWYQGESNAGRAYQYRELFPAMIRDWRQWWGAGDFPFYYVQLANFMQRRPEPGDSAWAELREAQLLTLSQPDTAMAVAIDIGEANDIHPRNKQDVGKRLALAALAKVHSKDVTYSGPLYDSMQPEDGRIRLRFRHTDGELKTSDGRAPMGFAIAGEDRRFVWAGAQIDGETVVVSSPDVPKPIAVRYGWGDDPDVNLINRSGLPASPFRTDDWPGLTEHAR